MSLSCHVNTMCATYDSIPKHEPTKVLCMTHHHWFLVFPPMQLMVAFKSHVSLYLRRCKRILTPKCWRSFKFVDLLKLPLIDFRRHFAILMLWMIILLIYIHLNIIFKNTKNTLCCFHDKRNKIKHAIFIFYF